jgi:hypothetical protein
MAAGVAFLSWNWIEKPVLSRKAVLLWVEGRFLSLPFLGNFRLQWTAHWPFGRIEERLNANEPGASPRISGI